MNNDDDLNNGQLLRDVEDISQALYLHKAPTEADLSQSKYQFGSYSKAVMQDVFHKNKKSSIWQWKPLKNLTHIRSHRFNCFFFLHVHSIEGLASNFNDLILCVNWKRKDEVFRTHPVRVFQGIAEFEETLMHQCSVYVSGNGPQNSLKYEPKLFLLHASVIGAPTLDIGKHWVDLARLLPLTLEELEEERRTSGKWTTSFKLKGKAKGAVLNVSFGFSVLGDNPFDSSHFTKVSDIMGVTGQTTICPPADIAQISKHRALSRLGSVPRKSFTESHHVSSQSLDMKFINEFSSNSKSELAESITFLYQKLEEGKFASLNEPDSRENLVPLKLKSALLTEYVSEDPGKELEDIDFIVIEQGIELPVKDELQQDHDCIQSVQESVIETDVTQSFPEDLTSFNENGESNPYHKLDFDNLFGSARDSKYEEKNEQLKEPTRDEPQTVSCKFLSSESAELKSSPNVSKLIEQENNMCSKASCGAGKMVRSLSVDDVTESVANEFLDMLGIEYDARDVSSDSEPESPRERLLKQFEKEFCAFGDSVFNLDAAAEKMEVNGVARSCSGRFACSDDFDLSMAIQEAEKDYNRVNQSLRSRRNAKMLENLETETLMQKWGLNEKVFENSPQATCGGFGSPIYVTPEEPSELPPLEEGLDSLIQIHGGGFLRSMNSSLFRTARNGAKLIMQVSNPVVLPAMMGYGVMDILEFWASGGAENMFVEANEVMPLLDITGKTIQQVSLETEFSEKIIIRPDKWGSLDDCEINSDLFCMQKNDGGLLVVHNAQSPGSISEDLHSEYVSLEDLIPLALANIEALSIEGLRIQSGLSYEEAPSSIRPQFIGNCIPKGEKVELDGVVSPSGVSALQLLDFKNQTNFNELMRLSISLDEWVRLDALDLDYKGEIDGHVLKILAAHHAKFFNLDGEQLTKSGGGCGLFGNNFTLALRLQLRDPLRDYEIVGEPMLALVQVERVSIPPLQEMVKMNTETNFGNKNDDLSEELAKAETSFQENYKKINSRDIPLFKISEVYIAGLNVEPSDRRFLITGKQHQSGSRWFFSSGMNRISKRPFSKSNAIIKPSSQLLRKRAGEILWSISSHVQHATKWKELAALNFHVRNPDIVLPSEPVRSLKA